MTYDTQTTTRPIYLSVVIPSYNEESRLPKTIPLIMEYLNSRSIEFEVIIVDDGSTDKTASYILELEKSSENIVALISAKNRGKGHAIRFGMRNAKGELLLFCDADGASPIEEVARLEQAITDGADVAIGSRALISESTSVSTVWYRKFLGRIFNGVVNFLVLPDVADTQCGFKLFKKEVGKKLFRLQRFDGFSFDVEILFLARKLGYQVAEVPINWTNIPGSKVNLITDSLRMLGDVIKLRLRRISRD